MDWNGKLNRDPVLTYLQLTKSSPNWRTCMEANFEQNSKASTWWNPTAVAMCLQFLAHRNIHIPGDPSLYKKKQKTKKKQKNKKTKKKLRMNHKNFLPTRKIIFWVRLQKWTLLCKALNWCSKCGRAPQEWKPEPAGIASWATQGDTGQAPGDRYLISSEWLCSICVVFYKWKGHLSDHWVTPNALVWLDWGMNTTP